MSDRVADLMSYGVQTVKADDVLNHVVSRLRRIGHEGYPVLEAGQVIGLLTRRDLDRAVEHGLGELRVADVMSVGSVTIKPDDSVDLLVQLMVESGWGQIPVLDDQDKLIGVVTRTDLIKYWGKTKTTSQTQEIAPEQIEAVLGQRAAALIELVGQVARGQKLAAYVVGGVVRDILLKRPNLDIDFVIEGDAIAFAELMKTRHGGEVIGFRPFGTAKWRISEAALPQEGTGDIPDHLDFATARNEFYEQPTALPSIYSGSIKLDLARRDFTINTVAIQISPVSGQVFDFFGGVADLNAKLIRVLHNLSFVDDPTRILRAVRFERRLGFAIERRTSELIEVAKPMLRRITGERLKNELTLLLREPDPSGSFNLLQKRGILQAVHHDFILADDLISRLGKRESLLPSWIQYPVDRDDLAWLLLLSTLVDDKIGEICERLLIGKRLQSAASSLIRLLDTNDILYFAGISPSAVCRRLEGVDELALCAAWLITDNSTARNHIEHYIRHWRTVVPITTGRDLIDRGLTPAPCFSAILQRLTDAWLDSTIKNQSEELALLETLIASGICDESRI